MKAISLVAVALATVWALAYGIHVLHFLPTPEAGGAGEFDGQFRWQDIPMAATGLAVFIACAIIGEDL